MKNMNRILALIPVGVFAIFALTLGLGLNRDPSYIPSVLINQPLPAFELAPVRPNDQGLANADLRGDVALVNVFGSWCSACRIEHPTLMQLARENAVPIYGIDWKDDPAHCMEYLADGGDPYRHIGGDPSGRTALDLGVTGAPETFIVDRSGRIRYKQVGPITPEVWRDTLAPMIAQLRAET